MVKRRKFLLSIKHGKRRVTVEDWTRATWSVETKINRIGSDGRMYICVKKSRQAFIDKE